MGDEEATWDTETECAKIARFLVSAREHFDLASRQSAQQALESNLAKAKQAASLRQQQAGPLSSFSPLSAARGCVPPVHLNNTMRGTSRTVLGNDMPLVEPNPSYKAWGYLVCNELAQGVGRQMYYTDEIGETIPLSDSDEEQDSDTESLDGVQREADMFLLSKAVSQFGARPEVVRIAASMMRAKRATVQTRMQSLAAAVPEGPAIQSEHQKLDVMVAKFTKSFCRRCRIFNCFAHTGPHTKPHQRRPAKPVISSSAACTKKCFKTCISADAGLALASTTADLLPPQASGNAMVSTVKKEEKKRTDLQAGEKDKGLALRSALHLAAPRQAARQGRSTPTPEAAVESLSAWPLCRAAENIPSMGALTRAAGHMSTAGPEGVQHSSMKSRKHTCCATSVQPQTVTAVALVADGAGATAVDNSQTPDSESAYSARKRIKHEAAAGTSSMNGRLTVQNTSPLPSRGQHQSNVSSAKDTIVNSDSEEDDPTATPSSKPIAAPHANAALAHAQTMGGTPTLTPLRIPSGKPMAAKSSPEAPNTGSASDPIEIDISSDDDQVPAPAWDWPGSAPNHLASGQNEVDTTPNRRGSAQGKLGSMQGSPTDLYVSLSDYSNTPQKTPITVRGRNTVQGSHAPLAHSAKGSRPPLSDSVKGSPAPFSGPIAVTPDPLQDPLSNHVKGNSGPFSLTRKGTPASLKGLPVSPPDALLESVRSAATSSALLSVPRRGRVILAESSPLHAMAALGKLLSCCLLLPQLQTPKSQGKSRQAGFFVSLCRPKCQR
ncbi:TPA: hypothetical protein ACH3X2_013401 [Trebouxia sp. C0005]